MFHSSFFLVLFIFIFILSIAKTYTEVFVFSARLYICTENAAVIRESSSFQRALDWRQTLQQRAPH